MKGSPRFRNKGGRLHNQIKQNNSKMEIKDRSEMEMKASVRNGEKKRNLMKLWRKKPKKSNSSWIVYALDVTSKLIILIKKLLFINF